jgi:hypothetical protein
MDAACTRCSRALPAPEILYSPEGAVVCVICSQQSEILGAEQRSAGNIGASAYASIAIAVCSLFINPFYVMTILAISSGAYALRSLAADNSRFSRHVGSSKTGIQVCAYAGIILAALLAALRLLGTAVRFGL